jgi:hypothetical protein
LDADQSDDNQTVPDLFTSSINCVRGIAAKAIESVLFRQRDKLEFFRPAIDALVNDPHPAVRIAAIGIALPIWNIDREEALKTFVTACSHQNDAVLSSPDINHFFSYTIRKHAEQLCSLVHRMMESSTREVAKSGAGWVGVVWAHSGQWKDKFEVCLAGPAKLREGLAEALARAVAVRCDNKDAVDQLALLFDDPDQEVQAAAAGFFRLGSVFEQQAAVALAEAFLVSAARDKNVDDFLIGLERHNGSLKPFAPGLLAVVDLFSGPLADEARDIRTRRPLDVGYLAKVLLRLYEQTEDDKPLRRRCLDAWDRMLSERIGHDVLQQIDA